MLLTLIALALAEDLRAPITLPMEQAPAELERQAPELQGWLRAHPGLLIELQVHTDSAGSAAYNQRISDERAVALKGQLVDAGVPPSRVVAAGKGESVPLTEDGADPVNRRVVLLFRPE